MSTILIFTIIIGNICEPQICFEAQKYSYISNSLNEIILESCQTYVDKEIFTANSHCYGISSTLDDSELSQKPISNVSSVEETYESESKEMTEEKEEPNDGGVILLWILFVIVLGASFDNQGRRRKPNQRQGYYKRTSYVYVQ